MSDDVWCNPKCPICDTVNWYAERTDDIIGVDI